METHNKISEFLIELGININVKDTKCNSALFYLTQYYNNIKVFKSLMKKDVDKYINILINLQKSNDDKII